MGTVHRLHRMGVTFCPGGFLCHPGICHWGQMFWCFCGSVCSFSLSGEDLLRPRLNGTHSCQLALLADAAFQRHWHRGFCYRSSPLQMAYWGVIAHTPVPSPELPSGCTVLPNKWRGSHGSTHLSFSCFVPVMQEVRGQEWWDGRRSWWGLEVLLAFP